MIHPLEIAKEALRHYPLTVRSVDYVGQSANTIYKVTDTSGALYSLRLHASKSGTMDRSWSDADAIRSEMAWLRALSSETDVTVPVPVVNGGGDWVTTVNSTACSVVEWVEGEQKPFIATVEEAAAIGGMMGRLHRQAASWTPPDRFERPSFDGERIMQALDKMRAASLEGWLGAEDTAMLRRAADRVIGMMSALERSSGNWGMIHADLIPSNLVYHGQEARPIDFGACGYGFYLFDLGWTFSYIHPALRAPLLDAYASHYPLPDNCAALLEGFFIAGQLETMNFWFGLPDAREWLPDHIAKLAGREAAAYVKDEPFLFGGTPYWE